MILKIPIWIVLQAEYGKFVGFKGNGYDPNVAYFYSSKELARESLMKVITSIKKD